MGERIANKGRTDIVSIPARPIEVCGCTHILPVTHSVITSPPTQKHAGMRGIP